MKFIQIGLADEEYESLVQMARRDEVTVEDTVSTLFMTLLFYVQEQQLLGRADLACLDVGPQVH